MSAADNGDEDDEPHEPGHPAYLCPKLSKEKRAERGAKGRPPPGNGSIRKSGGVCSRASFGKCHDAGIPQCKG